MTRSIFLAGNTVDLILLEADDVEVMQRFMNDHNVTQYLGRGPWPMYYNEEREWIESLPKAGHLHLGIWHKADEVLLGSCGLHAIDHVHQLAELGIVIGNQDYWGQGIGREAVTLLLQHGFDWLNLRHITLRVLGNNPRGERCYERCGFVRTGVIPEHVLKNGVWYDEVHMLCRREDWSLDEAALTKKRLAHIVSKSQ